MTDEEQKWMNEDYEEAIKNSNDREDNVGERFGKESFGHHELCDRSWILYENWESYVMNHPTIILDKDLYEKAWKINQALADFYQDVATWGCGYEFETPETPTPITEEVKQV